MEHTSYIGHHNGPQYFGYVAANPAINVNLHCLNDFFTDIAAGNLGTAGGGSLRPKPIKNSRSPESGMQKSEAPREYEYVSLS